MKRSLAIACLALFAAACNETGGGGDTSSPGDVATTEIEVSGIPCEDAQACCTLLAAQFGETYQAQCDAVSTATDAACTGMLNVWHSQGHCL